MNSITKKCKICGIEKSLSNFYFRKDNQTYRNECIPCHNQRNAKWRNKNLEKQREYHKKYYQEKAEYLRHKVSLRRLQNPEKVALEKQNWYFRNKERLNKLGREWRQKNIERAKETAKTWALSNTEKTRAYKAKWRKNHPEQVAIARHNRRAKDRGSYTKEEWKNLCEFYDNKCLRCGEKKKLTADHIVPLSCGGSNTIDNIQPLCGYCNTSKGTKTIDYRHRE